ncbi:MAG: 3-phosphoshikimate 1-carboxyvinyltransferase [Planctomycetota bacterium]
MNSTTPAASTIPEREAADCRVQVQPGGPVCGGVRVPGSKSLTNRALVLAALASGPSVLRGALHSEDTEVMIASLRQIGIAIDVREGGQTLAVDPTSRRDVSPSDHPPAQATDLFIGNSGTTVRFLSSALSVIGGHYRLHGVPRMHDRPIGDLVDAIRGILIGTIETRSPGGCPPVVLNSQGWNDDPIEVAGNVSSQYLSGLMMASGFRRPVDNLGSEEARSKITEVNSETKKDRTRTIQVRGELVSRPYVAMTAAVMASFGVTAKISDSSGSSGGVTSLTVAANGYRGQDYAIEPDASAATYFWAAAAVTGGDVTVEGLHANALQGDVKFVDVLEQMGCQVHRHDDRIRVIGGSLRGVDVDMNAISDTVQSLAPVALRADSPTRVRGVAHNRFKETDRIGDLATELRRLGATVEEHSDGMTIHPLPDRDDVAPVHLQTYLDHRMAMGLSLVGLYRPGVWITNPSCTGKTYPEFFADLERLIDRPHRWANGPVNG